MNFASKNFTEDTKIEDKPTLMTPEDQWYLIQMMIAVFVELFFIFILNKFFKKESKKFTILTIFALVQLCIF